MIEGRVGSGGAEACSVAVRLLVILSLALFSMFPWASAREAPPEPSKARRPMTIVLRGLPLTGGAAPAEATRRQRRVEREMVEAWLEVLDRPMIQAVALVPVPSRGGGAREPSSAARSALAQSWLGAGHSLAIVDLPVTIRGIDELLDEGTRSAALAGDRRALERARVDILAEARRRVLAAERQGDQLLGRTSPQILELDGGPLTLHIAREFLSWLVARGISFVPKESLLADPAFAGRDEMAAFPGNTHWDRMRWRRLLDEARADVGAILRDQAAAWSRGDLESFVAYYADDTLFISPTGETRGRAAVLERYRSRYPDPSAMGRLTLEPIDVRPVVPGIEPAVPVSSDPPRAGTPLGFAAVSVAARWKLTRDGQADARGMTLIVFHRRQDRWFIVQDASF